MWELLYVPSLPFRMKKDLMTLTWTVMNLRYAVLKLILSTHLRSRLPRQEGHEPGVIDKLKIAEVSPSSGLGGEQLFALRDERLCLCPACSAEEAFLGGICAGDSGCNWDGALHGQLLHRQRQELGSCPSLVQLHPQHFKVLSCILAEFLPPAG